jgi:hypothetical protein
MFVIFMLISTGKVLAQALEEQISEAETSQAPVSEKTNTARVGLSLGYVFSGYREETDMPLNRYLNTLTYMLDARVESGKLLHSFNIGFFTGKVRAVEVGQEDDFFAIYRKEATFTRVYLEYALDFQLWGNQRLPGYLGGALRGDIYYNSLAQTLYYSFTGIASLNVHATQKWIINEKNTLALSVSMPLFGYARRPPYFGFSHDLVAFEDKITSLHNYWAVFGDLKYHLALNSLISLCSGLGFEFSYLNFPQPRKDAMFRLNAGIAFSF